MGLSKTPGGQASYSIFDVDPEMMHCSQIDCDYDPRNLAIVSTSP